MSKILLERFERFWKAYPRKMNIGYAEKVWLRIRPDEKLLEIMLKNIEEGKRSKEWKDKQFIPFPSTYLNQKGYYNEFTPLRPVYIERQEPVKIPMPKISTPETRALNKQILALGKCFVTPSTEKERENAKKEVKRLGKQVTELIEKEKLKQKAGEGK